MLGLVKRIAGAVMLVVLSLAGARSLAQAQNTGTVGGNVSDAQGALVAGATVTLSANGEGRVLTAKTNKQGEYLFSDVQIGTYTLTVKAPTFESYVVSDLVVNADANFRQDAKLTAGSVDAQVTVEASGTTLDTRSATLGTMIDSQLVANLPIDGENVVSLAALLPGVTNVNAPATFTSDTGGPTYSVSGSRGNQNLFLFDGIIWNNVFYNTGLNYPPRYALEEVSVLLNNYKAQYGRNSGSIFNVLTKRGTNQIHGTVWENYQNSYFDAADYITKVDPHLVENQFGATIGGPIKRDKVYFFVSYQDLRLAGQAVAKDQLFSNAELGLNPDGVTQHPCSSASPFYGQTCGDFSADFCYTLSASCLAPVAPNAAIRNPIYTEGTTAITALNAAYIQNGGTLLANQNSPCVNELTAYMNTQTTSSAQEHLPTTELPTNCYNPVIHNFVQKYFSKLPPAANGSTETNSVALQPRNDQEGLVRGDWNVNSRHTIDARFYVTNVNDITSNSVSSGNGVSNYELDKNVAGIYSGNIGDTWVITPNILNVVRAGYKRYTYIIIPTDRTTLASLGANYTQPGHNFLPKMEATNRFTVGSSNSGDSYTMTANEELDDSVTWTRGTHNFQFGGQFLDLDYVHRFDQVPVFESEQQYTETSASDFLLGFQYQETVGNSTNLAATQYAVYMYAQDDWRASSKLTLNYGLRYEIPFSWKETDGWGATFKPGYQSVVFPTSPSSVAFQNDPGIGNPAPATKYKNLAPRIGFAYDVFGTGRLAIRGGFGLFFDSINANVVGISEPYHYTATYAYPSGGYSVPLLDHLNLAASGGPANQEVLMPAIPQNYVRGATPVFTLPYTVNYADPNLHNPYTEAVNFGYQWRVTRGALLEMNYVGKFGRHGIIPIDQNPSIYDCTGSYFQANPTVYCPSSESIAETPVSYAARSLYPGFNYGGQGIVDIASVGTSNYNGLQVIYSQRAAKRLNTYMSYTYGRSIDESSNGATNTANVPQPHKLNLEYAASDFNATQILNLGWVLTLPKVASDHTVRAQMFNDWSFGGIYNARTGNPFSVTDAGDVSYTDQRTQRAQLIPGMNPNLPSNRHRSCPPPGPGNCKLQEWFNVAAFQEPTFGTFSDLRRNSMVGPAYINTNMDVQKYFTVGEGKTVEFRMDAFNLFNTPNLAQPNAAISGSTSNQVANNFGQILSTVGTNGAVGTNGRRLQFAVLYRY